MTETFRALRVREWLGHLFFFACAVYAAASIADAIKIYIFGVFAGKWGPHYQFQMDLLFNGFWAVLSAAPYALGFVALEASRPDRDTRIRMVHSLGIAFAYVAGFMLLGYLLMQVGPEGDYLAGFSTIAYLVLAPIIIPAVFGRLTSTKDGEATAGEL